MKPEMDKLKAELNKAESALASEREQNIELLAENKELKKKLATVDK